MALDYFALNAGFKFDKKNKLALSGAKTISGEKVVFVKPLTYMNLSGNAVKFFADKHKVQPADILIIHDDMDLELYALKIKKGGGDAGHNGIKSITGCLGTPAYGRARVGIGRPEKRGGDVDFVLGKMSGEEKEKFAERFAVIEKFIYDWISMGYERAAGRFVK